MKIEKKMVTKRTKWAKDNHPQVEIRVSDGVNAQALFVVTVDGWNLKDRSHEARNPTPSTWMQQRGMTQPNSRGKQIRVSMNGPLMLTMTEWKTLSDEIDKAYGEVVDEFNVRGL